MGGGYWLSHAVRLMAYPRDFLCTGGGVRWMVLEVGARIAVPSPLGWCVGIVGVRGFYNNSRREFVAPASCIAAVLSVLSLTLRTR